MTTRWRQKASSILAVVCVICLLLLIIFLWTAVKNGMFTTTNNSPYNKINISSDHRKFIEIQQRTSNLNNNNENITFNGTIIELPSPRPPDINRSPSDPLNEIFVRPSKIHVQPLHRDDLLYESQKFDDPHADTKGEVPDHRITGQFRNKSSRIWDPHPQYVIDAFGIRMHLVLNQDAGFIPKNMKITHIWHNETLRKKEDHKDYEKLKGCFYKGRVQDDNHSAVTVSLCDGMRGHIYTSYGSFFIQPIEEYTNENPNILHKISRENISAKVHHLQQNNDIQESQCGTCHNHKDCNNHSTEDILSSDEITSEHQNSINNNNNSNNSNNNDNNNNYNNDNNNYSYQNSNNNNNNNSHNSHNRHKRDITPHVINNSAYTMEVLVAVDRKMQEYHGSNIKAYVLTLMSIVSSVYSDASIGNSINIAVVHILLLKDDLNVQSNHIGVSASQMLSGFCKFIKQYKFKTHHDTALLLTREQICRSANQMKCDTLGLAELGTMCRPSSCAIVQDNGLSAAFTIAHELGHVLSMPHDDDIKCAKFRKPGKNQQNIMSRMLDHDTHPWSWSDCSRHYVTEYLENNYGICMLDKPIHDMIEPTSGQLLAGEKFSANQQCELVFGSGSKVCSYMPTCSRLWCGNDAEGCRTQHMPWADGTECAVNSWCQRGKCVHRNREALVKIDGAWGSWKQYGECSRHCGGGIQSAIRDCNSPSPANGGKYCIGNRIRYRSCNTHDCSKNSVDFREEQCSEYNNNNYDIPGLDKNVKWVPKYGASPKEECKLYCRVENTNNYFVLNEKVKDGTSCTRDSFDKCVNGICRAAGCDNELDSIATLDKCGVCKGKNNTCYDISGKISGRELEYNKQYSKKPYYYYVIKIMKGASNIDIIQKGYPNDYNYIALMDDNGDYILNGYNVVTQYPRTFPYGGVIFEYTGTNDTNERVTSTYARKLTKDLTVEILSRNDYYDIDNILEYSFTMQNYTIYNFEPYNEKQQHNQHSIQHTQQQQPPHNSHNNQQSSQHNVNVYQWQMSEWNDCDQICEGNRFRTPVCILIEIGTKVSPNYCHQIKKPLDEYQTCNTNCNVRWEITRSECTSDCGEGVIKVKHNCVQTFMQTGKSIYVDEKYCPGTAKPLTYEKCLGPCRLAAWIYENWGPCSRTCGGGTQTRTASCASDPSGNYYIEESYCLQLAKEDLIRACNQDECPRWSYGDDTACSVTCGTGIRRTTIVCKQNNNIVETNVCNNYPRPETKILNCTMDPCHRSIKIAQSIPFLYVDDIPQTATRSPYLINSNANTNNNNHNSNSPPTTSPRNYFNSGYKWRTSRWGPCSVSCGNGQRLRSVRCGNITSGKHELVDDRYCSDDRPTNVTNCDNPCPVWHYSAWSECQSDCKRQRQVICHDKLRMIDKKSCNSAEEPHSHETCCHFRWRNMWTPCNVTCGIGVRRRQRVCMRLYPKSDKNPHPRKKGQSVDYQYCSHMKQPPFYPKQKACRKQCDVPKWDVTSWSKCSVGCGQGYATRDVRCMLGKQLVNDTNCFATQKPIKTRHCESNSECKWKTGPWKNCSCGGFTKRRIQCYDSKLNKLSNSCNERIKPIKRKKCPQPANCSCKGIKTIDGKTTDGEYEMNVRGRKVKIYCHNMKSELPQEFLTLPDYQENFSTYFGQRSKDSNQCPTSRSGEWHDSSIPAGITYFSKIRINLHTLQVIEDDLEFSHTTGRPQTFASAGDCYSTTRQCPRGEFSINFTGTKFRIKPQTLWDVKGQNSTMIFRYKLEPPFNRVRASCGGYCGGCFPSKSTTLQLEIL